MWLFIGGAAVFAWVVYKVAVHHYVAPSALPASCSTDACPINIGSPSPTNTAPVAGFASAKGYRWCIEIKPGDTAGKLAERITGDPRRYLELLAANPSKKRKTDPVTGEVNFDWSDFQCPGEKLPLPDSWTVWMDQKGNPRGKLAAFPPFDTWPAYPVAVGVITTGKLPDPKTGGWS